jgi:hypothetical protein
MADYVRNNVLADLRKNVIEITVNFGGANRKNIRCTLIPEHLPPNYLQEQKQEEMFYHDQNPDKLAVWNIHGGGWALIDINNVIYCQILDAY